MRTSILARYWVVVLFLSASVSNSCTEEEISERPYPRVITISAELAGNDLLLKGELIYLPDGVKDYGFVYTTTGFPVIKNSFAHVVSLGRTSAPTQFSDQIRNLPAGTYDIAAFAQSATFVSYGETMVVVKK